VIVQSRRSDGICGPGGICRPRPAGSPVRRGQASGTALALTLLCSLAGLVGIPTAMAQYPSGGGTYPGWMSAGGETPRFSSAGPDAYVAQSPGGGPVLGAPAGGSSPPAQLTDDEPAGEASGQIPVRNLFQILNQGGVLMYAIALCSIVLMVFVFERSIALRTGRVIPKPFVMRILEQLEQQQIGAEEAAELCQRNPSAVAQVLMAGIKKHGRSAVEVEQAVLDAGERVTNHLRRYLRLLSAISNVSPLLGLLGTVLGMIQAFNNISRSDALGRPELLAGGIATALLTTAAGLLVAIPAYLAYTFFLGRVDRLVMEIDQHSQRLVEAISAEALQAAGRGRGRSKRPAA
jgi:biopolymer transport protein ExbB